MVECNVVVKGNFYDHPKAHEIICKVKKSLEYFPEVEELTLLRHGTKGGKFSIAEVPFLKKNISFNVNYFPSYNTIFHELGHVLQGLDIGVPKGEESCTIFALARLPLHLTDSNRLPYLELAPIEKIQEYCKQSLKERESGNRKYIKWLKDKLESDKQKNPDWPKRDIFEEDLIISGYMDFNSPIVLGQTTLVDFTSSP